VVAEEALEGRGEFLLLWGKLVEGQRGARLKGTYALGALRFAGGLAFALGDVSMRMRPDAG
jgi:hypothetical protein